MSVLRDIFRRKLRSLLTISGVAVGIFALVVLGSVSEKVNLSVRFIGDFYKDRVTVVDAKDAGVFGLGGGKVPISTESLAKMREMPGVERVETGVSLLQDETAIPMGMPALIIGGAGLGPGEPKARDLKAAQGRLLEAGDRHKAVVGKDLVRQLDAEVGETVELRGQEFEVIGLLDRTFVQAVDQSVIVPVADAQQLFADSLPDAFAGRIDPADVVLQASVVAEDGTNPDELARRIAREVDDVLATGPTSLAEQVGQLVLLLNLVVAAVGAVAMLVGALSVVNTMVVAVVERTHEVGVKRALGASGVRIARDVLFESAVMSGIGGVFGVAGAAAVVAGVNWLTTASTGTASLYLTWRLAIGAVVFALVLGVIGGVYPARYASKLDPVDALAHE